MVKNRIKLIKRSIVEIPLYHEVKEGKVHLAIRIWENGAEQPLVEISKEKLESWLNGGDMQYHLTGRTVVIYHREEKIWVVWNAEDPGEMEYQTEWEDVYVKVKGSLEQESKLLLTEKVEEKATTVASSFQKESQEEVEELKAQLQKVQREYLTIKKILDGNIMRNFHESGQYVKSLIEAEELLDKGPGMEQFEKWKKRKEELDKQIAKKEEEERKIKIELEEREQKIKKLDETIQEERKGLEELDALNEETLKELEDNRARLEQDEEVLKFIQNNNLDVKKTLKDVEHTLQKTEEMVRKVIVMRENKAEQIEKKVRGDKTAEK